ncbi:metallophosphoesterase [Actinocrinis puniceicyclus]|uniref:Metallophosphoesterase n=1 Tax=Actinocrinis puniceicyclus TaxID=977794 RepID=A0A8J7WTS1_9ACTN|nr:metallophosphoesterase [Actinocrinis puniceicyclus]MBS2966327.1 metallophosphoesterase [Actinocrinis puniceicyclus]
MLGAAGAAVAYPHSSNDWPYGQTPRHDGRTYTLAVVGDIACEPDTAENAGTPAALKCGSASLGGLSAEYATAGQADSMHPDLVALLGDEQYEVGKLSDFEQSFEQAWGGLKMLERPAPGNHEYYAYTGHGDKEAGQNGAGYFGYFNGHDQNGVPYAQGQAGEDAGDNQGWYSYDIGNWHVISLNIECRSAAFGNDCSTTGNGMLARETQWLAADLHADHARCTLAYWHQPTFSASTDAADPTAPGVDSIEGTAADSWWKLLYAAHASLILNGHEHLYARFRPMDPSGNFDPGNGIPQITVGTGGEGLDTVATDNGSYHNPNVVTAQDQAFGVMNLQLKPGGYTWDYRPVQAGPGFGATALDYRDSGSGSCRG